MSPRAKTALKRKRAPGAGRPRTVRAPGEEGRGRLELVLDDGARTGLLHLHRNAGGASQSAAVRELLTAYGGSARVRNAVAAWKGPK